jgi:hypothetical protein
MRGGAHKGSSWCNPNPFSATALLWSAAAETAPVNEFPFEFRDGLIWVEVQARESSRPLHFLLDSGAGASVINLHTSRELGLKRGRRVTVQGVQSTSTGYWPQHLSTDPAGIPVPKDLLCVDLAELSGSCTCPVDGLLGADFFAGRTVQIDFEARKIRWLKPGEIPAGKETLPLRAVRGAWLVPINVDHGKTTQWMRVDTGCAAGLQWVAPGVRSKAEDSAVAVALTRLSIPSTRTTVRIGTNEFADVPTGLHEREIFRGESGLLGNGLLSRFKSVTLDCRSGRIAFEKKSTPGAP